MDQRDVSTTSLRSLAILADLDKAGVHMWDARDTGAVFRHQMRSPVQMDLSAMVPKSAADAKMLAAAHGLLMSSYDDLVRHPAPPLVLLNLTKEFAKTNTRPQGCLPEPAARFLYYLVIAVALVRHDTRMSELNDDQLRKAWGWCLTQEWADETYRDIIRQAVDSLGRKAAGADNAIPSSSLPPLQDPEKPPEKVP